MNQKQIKSEVINIISEIFVDAGIDMDIIQYVDLVDDLGMDSLSFVTVVVEIEAKFGIVVPDEKLLIDNFKTVDSIVDIVDSGLQNTEE